MSDIVKYENDFQKIVSIIENAKIRAIKAVNTELIEMYWQIGKYISEKSKNDGWGKGVVKEFSDFLQKTYPSANGFSPQNIWRMKQFYETYCKNEKLSPLVRELSWSNNLLILSGCKTDEAREFYLRLSIANNYGKRELERQIDSALFERTMISSANNKSLIERNPSVGVLRDSYVLEFLSIPDDYKEKDLRKAILSNLKQFILEFGKDFTFMGEEYKVQVGNTDFFIDLLFYNRALSCLVAIELKVGKFKPEHLGQLNFYLEALDRDVRKENENPSVGLILCASKDDAVVEYALSRSLSPTIVHKTMEFLQDNDVIERLSELLFKLQYSESTMLPYLEQQLAEKEKEIENIINAVQKGYATDTLLKRLGELEQQRNEINESIAKEKLKSPIFTQDHFKMALCNFRKIDITKQDGKRKIIDTFINSIYLYDDHLKIIYNGNGKEETITLEELKSSTLFSQGAPNRNNPNFVIAYGVFGFSFFLR